jgi:hypothetical protein
MAETETRDEHWAEKVAWWTFLITLVSAVLFVGSVVVFILRAGGGL